MSFGYYRTHLLTYNHINILKIMCHINYPNCNIIARVDSIKYLSICIDVLLKRNVQINYINNKIYKTIHKFKELRL